MGLSSLGGARALLTYLPPRCSRVFEFRGSQASEQADDGTNSNGHRWTL